MEVSCRQNLGCILRDQSSIPMQHQGCSQAYIQQGAADEGEEQLGHGALVVLKVCREEGANSTSLVMEFIYQLGFSHPLYLSWSI